MVKPIEMTPEEAGEAVPGGVFYADSARDSDHTVEICGSNCVDRDEVAQAVRETDTRVRQSRCLGLCSMQGALEAGAYAIVPLQTAEGIKPTEVILRPRVA